MWPRFFMLALLCASCATAQPQNPFFDDAKYLRFGVDPRAEADELIKEYAERSEPLALRILGHDFTALGFMDRVGRATRTRIVTLRGISLALDPEPEASLRPARYALLSPPLPDTQDADGDGFEEVFIEKRMPAKTCLLVYRVRDVGFVDQVETRLRAFGQEHCASAVSDSDGDGRVELGVDVELVDFELPSPPTLRLMLWPDQHRYTPQGTGNQLAHFVAAQQAAREIELEQARAAEDSATVRRLAIELAALTEVLGLPTQDQLAELDHALSQFIWNTADRKWTEAARELITKRWKETPALVQPAPLAPSSERSGLADRDPS